METALSYSPADLAARWGVSRDTIYSLIRSGELPAADVSSVPIGRPQWRVAARVADEFWRRRTRRCESTTRARRPAVAGCQWYEE